MTITDWDLYAELEVGGDHSTRLVRDACTELSVSLTAPGQSELRLTMLDPTETLLGTGLLARGQKVTWAWQEWTTIETELVEIQGVYGFVAKARNRGIQALLAQRGAQIWTGISPSQYVRDRAASVGLAAKVEPLGTSGDIIRQATSNRFENDWEVMERLANEQGAWLFESAGVVVFGRPSWLASTANKVIDWKWTKTNPIFISRPRGSVSTDAVRSRSSPASLTATMPTEYGRYYRPGTAVEVSGIKGFNGRYLVTSQSLTGGSPTMEITVEVPVDPEPNLARDPSTTLTGTGGTPGVILPSTFPSPANPGGDYGSGSSGRAGLVENFVSLALAQRGDSYRIGAGRNIKDSDPDVFDCSGLIIWSAGQLGIQMAGTARSIRDQCFNAGRGTSVDIARKTRGALLFRTRSNISPGTTGHCAISLGDGRTIEAKGTKYGVVVDSVGSRFEEGGFVPGMSYPSQSGFVPGQPRNAEL
jgi:cell wall-associated NlpC family hydrolase